ncbi:uncharacterized protein LOC116304883 [Actinia tenebrosa]|uniref:Uncharacterized protein LOC116304883 n=1 Tax=Actinia tenebrosa TaxID=6105 RepID=A0A6P8IU09_ACTTE|nr:uncharacterized protein LOC116304883 [Actinia tenebrosa]
MMPKMVDILLVGFLLAGILIKPLTCPSLNETKCLMYLDEVREILGSKVPPINDSRMTDNYYNMSRALFPSVDLPSLYVRVTIQFLKDYQNGTKMIDDQKKNLKFTWSKACSYVSVQHISLYAMSVFSLFTIYPQRRETELVITVPPFCHDSPYRDTKSETWRYVVSMVRFCTVSCHNVPQ